MAEADDRCSCNWRGRAGAGRTRRLAQSAGVDAAFGSPVPVGIDGSPAASRFFDQSHLSGDWGGFWRTNGGRGRRRYHGTAFAWQPLDRSWLFAQTPGAMAGKTKISF